VQAMDKGAVDAALARMFYANGLSFNLVLNPYFKDFVAAVAGHGYGYKAPTYNRLREDLLDSARSHVEADISKMADKSMSRTGCTVTSDGWDDANKRALLNFLRVSWCHIFVIA
jgi:Protein of unknown function (DUF 659)